MQKTNKTDNQTKLTRMIFKRLYLLPAINFAFLGIAIMICFGISLYNTHVSIYLPFISETGAFPPALNLFSMSLYVGSFLGIVVTSHLHLILCSICSEIEQTAIRYTFLIGYASWIGLAGVAAVPMSTVFWLHLVVAFIYFGGAYLFLVGITYITYKRGGSKLLKLRFIFIFIITILLAMMVVVFPWSLHRWKQDNPEILAALKTPSHKGFARVFVASTLEWSLVILMNCYLVTFFDEMKERPIEVSTRIEDKQDDDVDVLPPSEVL